MYLKIFSSVKSIHQFIITCHICGTKKPQKKSKIQFGNCDICHANVCGKSNCCTTLLKTRKLKCENCIYFDESSIKSTTPNVASTPQKSSAKKRKSIDNENPKKKNLPGTKTPKKLILKNVFLKEPRTPKTGFT